MDNNKMISFLTFLEAQAYLQLSSNPKCIIDDLSSFIFSWKFKSLYDLECLNEDVDEIINKIKDKYFESNNDIRLYECIHCVVHNVLWDDIKPILRVKYVENDNILYEKSKSLVKAGIVPITNDNMPYHDVPCIAAIVELSMLDSYNSPIEKLNCLCTTYDIIFAELKAAFVTIISKYSEKEVEIPVINNEDIDPILSIVFIKSQLRYLYSNLIYIKLFGEKLLEDNNKRYILHTCERVIQKFLADNNEILQFKSNLKEIDYREVIKTFNIKNEVQNTHSFLEENRRRLLSLIFTSTTTND